MWLGNDLKLPQTRLTIVSYIILGMIALLLVGFWKLQVIDSDRYTQLAERNRVRTIPLEDLHKQLDESRGLPKFQPILIKPEASPADIAFIESHRADLQVLEMV